MNKIRRIVAAWLLIFVILFNAVGCDLLPDIKVEGSSDVNENGEFRIDAGLTLDMMVGDTVVLELINTVDPDGEVIWTSTSSCATVEDGKVTAITKGTTIIKATLGANVARVILSISDGTEDKPDDQPTDKPDDKPDDKPGDIIVGEGGEILLPNEEDPITSDPYVGVDKDEFYSTYSPAISYNDAYYRTQHGLMSGSIDEQDQEPTISSYQPTSGGKLVRNNAYLFSADGNTYYVVDGRGEIVMEIYRGGAYVVLEEVAAYVFAFGEPPANHSASKKTRPTASIWGIYLRVNNTKFSGDTSKYPYEPVLPRISGCGGDLNFYEMEAHFRDGHVAPYYVASRAKQIERLKAVSHHNDPDGVILYGVYGENKDKVVLIRQYRYPLGGYVYEFPAGLVEEGEDMQEAGIREMYEETGLTFIPKNGGSYCRPFFTTIGMTDESCGTVYGYCSGEPTSCHQEASEEIQVVIADRDVCRRILK